MTKTKKRKQKKAKRLTQFIPMVSKVNPAPNTVKNFGSLGDIPVYDPITPDVVNGLVEKPKQIKKNSTTILTGRLMKNANFAPISRDVYNAMNACEWLTNNDKRCFMHVLINRNTEGNYFSFTYQNMANDMGCITRKSVKEAMLHLLNTGCLVPQSIKIVQRKESKTGVLVVDGKNYEVLDLGKEIKRKPGENDYELKTVSLPNELPFIKNEAIPLRMKRWKKFNLECAEIEKDPRAVSVDKLENANRDFLLSLKWGGSKNAQDQNILSVLPQAAIRPLYEKFLSDNPTHARQLRAFYEKRVGNKPAGADFSQLFSLFNRLWMQRLLSSICLHDKYRAVQQAFVHGLTCEGIDYVFAQEWIAKHFLEIINGLGDRMKWAVTGRMESRKHRFLEVLAWVRETIAEIKDAAAWNSSPRAEDRRSLLRVNDTLHFLTENYAELSGPDAAAASKLPDHQAIDPKTVELQTLYGNWFDELRTTGDQRTVDWAKQAYKEPIGMDCRYGEPKLLLCLGYKDDLAARTVQYLETYAGVENAREWLTCKPGLSLHDDPECCYAAKTRQVIEDEIRGFQNIVAEYPDLYDWMRRQPPVMFYRLADREVWADYLDARKEAEYRRGLLAVEINQARSAMLLSRDPAERSQWHASLQKAIAELKKNPMPVPAEFSLEDARNEFLTLLGDIPGKTSPEARERQREERFAEECRAIQKRRATGLRLQARDGRRTYQELIAKTRKTEDGGLVCDDLIEALMAGEV